VVNGAVKGLMPDIWYGYGSLD